MAKETKAEAKAARLARTRFIKGRSGNPSGRPKSASSLLKELRLVLEERDPADKQGRTYCASIARKMVMLAAQGSIRAQAEIFDRLIGKAPAFIFGGGMDSTDREERQLQLLAVLEQLGAPLKTGDRVN